MLGEKRGERSLQDCNICCSIATQRGRKPEKKTCYSSNYIKLNEMQQYATKRGMSATPGGSPIDVATQSPFSHFQNPPDGLVV